MESSSSERSPGLPAPRLSHPGAAPKGPQPPAAQQGGGRGCGAEPRVPSLRGDSGDKLKLRGSREKAS